MSKVSEFAAAVQTSFDTINTSVTDLQGDVQTLNDKITALQNSPGEISPEDQALLDGIQSQASAITSKLSALDDLTPPAAPVEEPAPGDATGAQPGE